MPYHRSQIAKGVHMSVERELGERIGKAGILVEALPYIKKFAGQTIVIKYGGSLMENPELSRSFAKDIVLLKYVGMNPVIVHGGGKDITAWMKRLGKEASFINGQRVTDAETMTMVEMILSGKVNSEIVSLINQAGGKAVGLSGKDANLFLARKMKPKGGVDLGFVGEIESADGKLLTALTSNGYIPVISSVGESKDGETLNINADSAAAAVAIGLNSEKLIFLTDVQGISIAGKLLDLLDLEAAEKLLGNPEISGGMIPKLQDTVRAIKKGVQQVHIISGLNEHAVLLEIFTHHGVGTLVMHKKPKGKVA